MGVGQCRVRRVYAACAGGGVSKVFGFIETFSGKRNRDFAVAVAMGVKVVIMAELLGASEGVGARIEDARAMLETSTVMAYVVLVIVFVSLFEYLITKPLEILFMPWRR